MDTADPRETQSDPTLAQGGPRLKKAARRTNPLMRKRILLLLMILLLPSRSQPLPLKVVLMPGCLEKAQVLVAACLQKAFLATTR